MTWRYSPSAVADLKGCLVQFGCEPPGLLQESLEPFELFGPPEVSLGMFLGPSGPGSGVSKKHPESVPEVSRRCPGHSGGTFWTLRAWGPKGPKNTLRDTPGARRARRAKFGSSVTNLVRRPHFDDPLYSADIDLFCPISTTSVWQEDNMDGMPIDLFETHPKLFWKVFRHLLQEPF